jgi:hypothetical protein
LTLSLTRPLKLSLTLSVTLSVTPYCGRTLERRNAAGR